MALTTLGTVHTAIAVAAVIAGIVSLVRAGRIVPDSGAGKVYVTGTVLTCLTGFGIFQHGGFGDPHVLGIVTLAVLAVAVIAGRTTWFGRASPYVETVSYSATVFFHTIPGVTETFTRLPVGAPLFSGPADPALQRVVVVLFVLFLIGAGLQVRKLRSMRRLRPLGV